MLTTATFDSKQMNWTLLAEFVLTVLVTQMDVFNRLLDTTPITLAQFGWALVPALVAAGALGAGQARRPGGGRPTRRQAGGRPSRGHVRRRDPAPAPQSTGDPARPRRTRLSERSATHAPGTTEPQVGPRSGTDLGFSAVGDTGFEPVTSSV